MTFAIILLMTLTLGVAQVAFVLYARNVIASSAHEGARAAVERGRSDLEAEAVAREVVSRSAGGLIEHLTVDIATTGTHIRRRVTVSVRGVIKELGPIPIAIPVHSIASAELDETRT